MRHGISVAATGFDARRRGRYAAAGLLAATSALLGVVLGPILSRLAGVVIAFLVPFLDRGIAQRPMLRDPPGSWAHILPGYGAGRMLLDAGLTAGSTKPGSGCSPWRGWSRSPAFAAWLCRRSPTHSARA